MRKTVLTEYVFEYAFRFGLDHIYNNQSVLEEIFNQFKEDFLLSRYGQSHLDDIKEFINTEKIDIYHSWRLDNFDVPSYTIMLMSEGEVYKALNDTYPGTGNVVGSADILTNVPVLSYDATTGYATLDNSVDLTTVFSGHFLEDNNAQEFKIAGAIVDRPTEKKVFLGKNLTSPTPVIGIGKITTGPRREEESFGSIRMANTVNIGIHGEEPHQVKYLYYIALFILNRFKKDLFEDRGVELSTYSASDTTRIDEYDPDHVFNRTLSVNCFTEFVWSLGKDISPVTGIGTSIVSQEDNNKIEDGEDLDEGKIILNTQLGDC